MRLWTRRLLFCLFFLSGFCSLVYQVVWTRLAFASFGIVTPVLSVVISVFMLGLALGAWLAGRSVAVLVGKTGLSAVFLYAITEVIIGLGGFAVPRLFAVGEVFLLGTGQTDSLGYLSLSALVLALSILPWCIFMGATFPLMMAYVRERESTNTESFSFLYLANVLGAMSGTFLTAVVLIEILGFRHTLYVAAAVNFFIALVSAWLGWKGRNCALVATVEVKPPAGIRVSSARRSRPGLVKFILFSTGFCAMAMEVCWARAFTPVLKTQVYSFASVVFIYLGATCLGSLHYRRHLRKSAVRPTSELISHLAFSAFLPIIINDYSFLVAHGRDAIDLRSSIFLLLSILPFCAVLGYLTPSLIDESGSGEPAEAGKAYALNVFGCIIGPLVASYVLLPWMKERYALIFLCLPFIAIYIFQCKSIKRRERGQTGLALSAVLAYSIFITGDFQDFIAKTSNTVEVRRDYAASVISAGEGKEKLLLVNGVSMTFLSPITKFMVHLPLAFHADPPKSVLIICFGMGTSYRSALSWNLKTTAVELVPSVRQAFGFYHADAAECLRNAKGEIVIDDGRRYLRRTTEKFDVIVIDPPPPVEAAGSSLLYSKEFYELAKQHLKPKGIIQAWFPGGELKTAQSVVRAVDNSFPHVRCFRSVEGWGMHVLASMDAITNRTGAELAERMPEIARNDLREWSPTQNLSAYFDRVIKNEVAIKDVLSPDLNLQITDDKPFNEYYLLHVNLTRQP